MDNGGAVKKNSFWKGAVAVLIALLIGQSVMTYTILTRQNADKPEQSVNSGQTAEDTVKLVPRKSGVQTQAQVTPSPKSGLKPPPLPRLNVNVGSLPGAKPSITQKPVPQPTYQPSQPAGQFQYPRHQMSPFSSMNINIGDRKSVV